MKGACVRPNIGRGPRNPVPLARTRLWKDVSSNNMFAAVLKRRCRNLRSERDSRFISQISKVAWTRALPVSRPTAMKVAIEGCSHGELDNIYASISRAEAKGKFKTDLLLLCGDFQAIRNVADLQCLAVPKKYRQLGDFHGYYSGKKKAPILTLVIGGNHEASNYLWELYHGGWLAPNIYFLGEAGVVDVGGLRIAGASGIYKSEDYNRGRPETVPYNGRDLRSVYHTRVFDIWRLKLLAGSSGQPDIVLSHDWPNTIERHGDVAKLKKDKPYFTKEIDTATLGSPPLLELLQTLRPKYWFSAHLHTRFAALYKHNGQKTVTPGKAAAVQQSDSNSIGTETKANPDEIEIDDSDEEQQGREIIDEDPHHSHDAASEEDGNTDSASVPSPETQETRFLALSKCLPKREFLQFLDIPAPDLDAQVASSTGGERPIPSLRFVPRWLAILRATNRLLSLTAHQPPLPAVQDVAFLEQIDHEERWVQEHIATANQIMEGNDPLSISQIQHFYPTAPSTSNPQGQHPGPPSWFTNPQTESLCQWLDIENKINPPPPVHRPPPLGFPGSGPIPNGLPPGPAMALPPMHLTGGAPPLGVAKDDEEIRRIEAAALRAAEDRHAVKKSKREEEEVERNISQGPEAALSTNEEEIDIDLDSEEEGGEHEEARPLRLDDDDDGVNARWKEGTG